MLLVKLLRALAPLAVLLAAQVGLYLVLRELFAPLGQQKSRRRAIAAIQIGLGIWLPIFFVLGKAGRDLPPVLRWFAQPLLAYHMLSIPALVVLGLAVSVAHRWMKPDVDAPLDESRRIFLAKAATGFFGATGIAAVVGIHEAEMPPTLARHDVFIPGLHPDLDGVTICQLSDVHAGMVMTEEKMAGIARTAAALQPDLVVFTGDLLDMSRHAGPPFARAFSSLHGKLGTFGILGNHDYYAGSAAAVRAVQDAGGILLRNAGRRIEKGKGSLWIGGIDDPLCVDQGGSVDADKALRGAAPEEARILLAHRPNLFPDCAAAGANLVLSGHTHGGQIALGRTWSMARLIGPYTMGFYRHRGSQLFVHRGLGVVAGVPLRLGSRPEIALLTLRRS